MVTLDLAANNSPPFPLRRPRLIVQTVTRHNYISGIFQGALEALPNLKGPERAEPEAHRTTLRKTDTEGSPVVEHVMADTTCPAKAWGQKWGQWSGYSMRNVAENTQHGGGRQEEAAASKETSQVLTLHENENRQRPLAGAGERGAARIRTGVWWICNPLP